MRSKVSTIGSGRAYTLAACQAPTPRSITQWHVGHGWPGRVVSSRRLRNAIGSVRNVLLSPRTLLLVSRPRWRAKGTIGPSRAVGSHRGAAIGVGERLERAQVAQGQAAG